MKWRQGKKLDLYQLHFGGACELLLQLAIVQSRCVLHWQQRESAARQEAQI